MAIKENQEKNLGEIPHPKLKSTERACPRCSSVLYQNEKEECCECLNCGYIDCGDD